MNENNSYAPYSNTTSYPNSAYPSYGQTFGSSYYQGYGTSQYSNLSTPSTQVNSQSTSQPDYSWSFSQPPPAVLKSSSEGNSNDAVANEMKQQKAQLHKQREDYVKKLLVLQRELELLRNQKHELLGSESPPRDLDSIVKENEKLQDEIQTKMKAIKNVIEMLSSIIKDGLSISDLENELREDTPKKKRSKTPPANPKETHSQFNYVHYDPELHWCRMCDEFPKTAKEFLLHLQSKKHQDNTQQNDVGDNTPWHKLPAEPELPYYEGAPKKRIPIKGLQFFISAPSWYCKLCDVWIGDLHCASQHLKCKAHLQNYQNFVEQNPHWEMEWLKDREKALSRTGKNDTDSEDSSKAKKRKKKRDKKSMERSLKDKKKKKKSRKHKRQSSGSSSSSSSSDSSSDNEDEDKSRSIRVAMRNIKSEAIMQEDLAGKWEILGRLVEQHKRKAQLEEKVEPKPEVANDKLINQWMTINEPPEKEKYLLDSLKDRMKQKQSLENAKFLELEKRQKEREQREREELEKRQNEEKEAFEKRERDRKEQERLEFERILNKDRNQVKFKQNIRERQQYKRRTSPSPSPERHQNRDRNSIREREREYEKPKREKMSVSPRRSPPNKFRRYSGGKRSRSKSRSRSKGPEQRISKSTQKGAEKKPPGPPSYKKLPFIGRMPLFKNKKPEEKVEKEIQKEDYDKPRVTRFEPGNLPRAFIPDPDVVCFPKLSSYPELALPEPAPAPPKIVTLKAAPPPPKITQKPVKPPPPPKLEEPVKEPEPFKNEDFDPNLYEDPSHLWENSDNGFGAMYPPMYPTFAGPLDSPGKIPISHMMPLQPPPLPPGDDDLALLGISADDMAAQSF